MSELVPHNEIFVDPLENMLVQPLGDAELIASCELFQRQNAEFIAAPTDDDMAAKLHIRSATANLIQAMHPVTSAGMFAKAAVALALLLSGGWDQDINPDVQFTVAALHDMATPLAA